MVVAVTPDGYRVTSTSQDTTVAIGDLQTGKRVGLLAANSVVYCVALTSEGKVIALGDAAGAVRFFDVVEGATLRVES